VVCRVLSMHLALGLTFAASVTRAQAAAPDREAARAMADQGADAFARGDFERAHERLQRAFMLIQAPTIALLDARALVKLGRLVEARAAYRRAIEAPVDDASPPAFRDAVAQAQSEARSLERRLAWVTFRVRDAPADASLQVRLDGGEIPPHQWGAPVAVDPGAHGVRLDVDSAPGPVRRLELREGESRTVELEAPSRGGLSRGLTVAGFGLGGAGLLTGVVAGSLALSARHDAERRCPARRCVAGSSGAARLDDFRTYRTVSTVGYGVGFAGAALGTVMLLSLGRSEEVEVGIAPSGPLVGVRGAF
jgi:hypothetical protein